ncbi:MAG: 2TM domain-containing protein [Sandaracinaceae bacterium]
MGRQYSDEEVEAIFRRALERQVEEGDGYGHDELIAAAREVGLDDAQIDKAVREIEGERGEAALYERVKKRQRERWLRHFVTYVVVIGGLLGLHALGLMGVGAIWAAFGWGMGLALHTFSTFRGPTEEDIEKERTKLNRKARRAAAAKARSEAKRRKAEQRAARRARKAAGQEAGDEIERVIEEGVTLLLNMAAQKLHEANQQMSQPPRPPTAFDDFVAAKKAGRAPAQHDPVVTPPPSREPVQARVEVEAEADPAEAERRDRGRRRQRR